MRQAVTKELFAYWSRLKGARSAPDRADIDPSAIRHLLADAFIIEIDAGLSFPIRLCGTRLNAFWLREQKGRSFLDLWRAEDRRNVAAALLTVIDGVAPIVAGARAASAQGEDRGEDRGAGLEFELLLLPLRHFGKTHSRLLGSLCAASQPEWLGKAVARPLELTSLRVIDLGAEAKRARRPDGLPILPPAIAKRPHFIVHEGGKAR